MNRREFLKGTLGGGALVATSRLPVFAEEKGLFPGRGQYVVGGNYMFHGQEVLFP